MFGDIYAYDIRNLSNNQDILSGELVWSETTNTWQAVEINISNLSSGSYYVVCRFWVNGISAAESPHIDGDNTEFEIQPAENETDEKDDSKKKKPKLSDSTVLLLIIGAVIIIFLIFLITLHRIRKKS